MLNRTLASLIALALASGATAQDAVQWRTEDGGNGHWYQRRSERTRWPEALARCNLLGGQLASISTALEDGLVGGISEREIVWIGGSRSETNFNQFHWVDGSAWRYSDWAPGEPNTCNPCGAALYLVRTPQGWDDTGLSVNDPGFFAVIEWSADCNSDGIVDYGQILAGDLEDANANNIPDCCEQGVVCGCPGDVDANGVVNGVDLASVLVAWGSIGAKYPGSDANDDGMVDGIDLAIVLDGWGACL